MTGRRAALHGLARIVALSVGLLACAGAGAVPPAALPGCEPVLRALALLDAQARLLLRIDVESGRHPDGLRSVELHRVDGLERLLLDGRALRASPVDTPAADTLMLAPEGACERGAEARAADGTGAAPAAAALHYDAWAERGQARIVLWIDPVTGLPERALREAPELAWGRALSRPTKPPQAMLRPTGGRSVESIRFRYGADVPPVR